MGTVDRIIQHFLTASVEHKREFRKSTDDLCTTPAPLRSIPCRQEKPVYVVDAYSLRSWDQGQTELHIGVSRGILTLTLFEPHDVRLVQYGILGESILGFT